MLSFLRTRPGSIGIAICLAGVAGWTVFHRVNLHSPARIQSSQNILVPPETTPSVPSETIAGYELPFPTPDPAATDEQLLSLARTAVLQSPLRAIEWARSQNDPTLRRRLLSAVVRAWGGQDPVATLDWVMIQADDERQTDLDAALAGAVSQSQVTGAVIRQLLAADPDNRASLGAAFIVALNNAGQFQTALAFLTNAPSDSAADWTSATFRCWGQTRPQDALTALDAIGDENLRAAAFHALADGWSASDPATLAASATAMPAGENRDYALGHALNNWSLQDPAGLAAWLNTQPAGPEFDQGAALMIAKADGANYDPETALQWIDSISDQTLKLNSFEHLLGQWSQNDPAAAQQSVANASWLDESQRNEILKSLQNPSPTSADDE
jgi:hypothetical protein